MCSLIGVQQFQGGFYYCDIDPSLLSTIYTKDDCIRNGGLWSIPWNNFDNFFKSMLVSFQLFTGKGYIAAFYSAIDSRGLDM
jgi:hypothetical protein